MNKVDLPTIVSYHDFAGTPDLMAYVHTGRDLKTGAPIAKIAVAPKCLRDCLDLLGLLLEADMPLCIIAMGEIGRHIRAVAPLYGSALTYGYILSPRLLDR